MAQDDEIDRGRSARVRVCGYLDRQVRQRREAAETASRRVRLPRLRGCDRDDRSEVPRPQTPEVQVGDLVATRSRWLGQLVGHVLVGVYVEQDRAAAWLATNFPRRARNPDSRVTKSIARRGARGPASRCTGRVREDRGRAAFRLRVAASPDFSTNQVHRGCESAKDLVATKSYAGWQEFPDADRV